MENGYVISQLRYAHHLSQAELASKLGVSKGAIGMWETNKRDPHLKYIMKMAEIFGVSPDFLLGHFAERINNPIILNPEQNLLIPIISPAAQKMLSTFSLLSEDNQDILIGEAKKMLKEQLSEEKGKTTLLSEKAT